MGYAIKIDGMEQLSNHMFMDYLQRLLFLALQYFTAKIIFAECYGDIKNNLRMNLN